MCPALLAPDLMVIPELDDSAIVKVSALEDPSVVVPINTRPLESMRSFSLPLSLKIIEPVPLLFASALKIKSTSEEKPSLHLTVPLSTITLPLNVETPDTSREFVLTLVVAAIPVKEEPSPLKLVAVITPALPNLILLPTSI